MNKITITLILIPLITLFPIASLAEQNPNSNWQVRPQACIVRTLGELCEVNLNIVLPELAEGEYCYFQNERRLVCFSPQNRIENIKLSFRKDTLFALKYTAQQILFSQTLKIKTRETNKQIRRVRDPWSFF